MGANIEEAGKANRALANVFPVMIVLMLTVIIFQVRSFSAMLMVVLTAPLGLAGVVPTLLLFHQPFGFNAILGLIALAGILSNVNRRNNRQVQKLGTFLGTLSRPHSRDRHTF
jgi:multidrug efflux pump subunit AcrB